MLSLQFGTFLSHKIGKNEISHFGIGFGIGFLLPSEWSLGHHNFFVGTICEKKVFCYGFEHMSNATFTTYL